MYFNICSFFHSSLGKLAIEMSHFQRTTFFPSNHLCSPFPKADSWGNKGNHDLLSTQILDIWHIQNSRYYQVIYQWHNTLVLLALDCFCSIKFCLIIINSYCKNKQLEWVHWHRHHSHNISSKPATTRLSSNCFYS